MTINKTNKNITIKSIAEELNISFSTVSKALNNSPLVKEKTRNAILKKAEEMLYTPNMFARGLQNKTTKTIGVIFNNIENTVWTHIFKIISIEMAKYGYTTLIGDAQFDEEIERTSVLSFLSRLPAFIILSSATANTNNHALLSDISDRLIIIGERIPGINCYYIDVDYEIGGYLSAIELLSKGHRQNLIITEPLSFPISNRYVQGIRRAYQEYGITLEDERLIFISTSIESGYSTIMELWDDQKNKFNIPFTGIMTFCDLAAHGIYDGLSKLGKRVPEDISVIGYDDNPLSRFSMPPLTTVHQPVEKMAKSCISIMKSVLLENKQEISYFYLEPHLMQRSSTCSVSNNRLSANAEKLQ